MAFSKWESFLERKEKGLGDEVGNADKNKPSQGKGTNPYHGPHAKNEPKPLVRVAEKPTDALGDKASPPFSNPKAACSMGEKPSYKNMKVEHLRENTEELQEAKKKDSEVKEFDPTLTCQFTGRKAIPAFYEVAKYMAHMLPQNESARRTFLRELKGVNGGLNSLLTELFGHTESYGEMVNQMSLPESKVARRLVRAMNENYSNWATEVGLMPKPNMPMAEGVDLPIDKRRPAPEDDDADMMSAIGAGEPPVPTDPSAGNGGGAGASAAAAPMPNPMMQDAPPPTAAPDGGMPQDPSQGMFPNPNAQPEQPALTMPDPAPMKPNREFAYHHMLKEMGRFDNMKNVMKEILGG